MERRGLWKESCEILEYIVLDLEPTDAHSYLALARLESRRERGQFRRWGQGGNSGGNEEGEIPVEESNEDGKDKGGSRAREIFETGTYHCPESVHLWHAWAMHEQSLGNLEEARELLEKALELDPCNGYVCHAYGMMEMQSGNFEVGNDEALLNLARPEYFICFVAYIINLCYCNFINEPSNST